MIDQAEKYREYVTELSQDRDEMWLMTDFLYELVQLPKPQAEAWLKDALKFPMESLSKIMGGLDFADWQADQDAQKADAEAEHKRDIQIEEGLEG